MSGQARPVPTWKTGPLWATRIRPVRHASAPEVGVELLAQDEAVFATAILSPEGAADLAAELLNMANEAMGKQAS